MKVTKTNNIIKSGTQKVPLSLCFNEDFSFLNKVSHLTVLTTIQEWLEQHLSKQKLWIVDKQYDSELTSYIYSLDMHPNISKMFDENTLEDLDSMFGGLQVSINSTPIELNDSDYGVQVVIVTDATYYDPQDIIISGIDDKDLDSFKSYVENFLTDDFLLEQIFLDTKHQYTVEDILNF